MRSLIHELVDHQIALMRHDAHLRRLVQAKLGKTLKELSLMAASADEKTLRAVLKAIERITFEVYGSISNTNTDDMAALLAADVVIQHGIFNKHGASFKMPTHAEIAKAMPLINGAGMEDWWAKQAGDVVFRFQRIVRQGLSEGWTRQTMTKRFANEAKIAKRHADSLIITAIASVSDKATELLKDANIDKIHGEIHLSILDSRTSLMCRGRDGLKWDVNKKPIGHNVAYQRPPLHLRCRSKLLTIPDKLPPTRASDDGPVPFETTQDDWLESKSEAEQDAILGKGRAKLWREGKITMSDMLDQTGRPLTLEELKARY